MTTSTVATLLHLTTNELKQLRQRYESLWHGFEGTDATRAQFAEFLAGREAHTVETLERYQAREDNHAALDVHVRLGDAFPFANEELTPSDNPSLEELIELAERTDELLENLSERIQVYAVSGELTSALEALEAIVADRRRHLSGAARELEDYAPSPPHTHD